MRDEEKPSVSGLVFSFIPPPISLYPLLRFFVSGMFAATTAKLTELQTLRGRLFILRRDVITTLACRALKHNIIARHNSPSQKYKESMGDLPG